MFNDFLHPSNISFLYLRFLISHFEIIGKDDNDEERLSICFISVSLVVFQFEISGKNDIDK